MTSNSTSARSPLFAFVADRISAFLAIRQARHQQRIDRAAFRNMLGLEDALLKDVGVSRADVQWASQLPLSQNAALELHKVSLQNRTKI